MNKYWKCTSISLGLVSFCLSPCSHTRSFYNVQLLFFSCGACFLIGRVHHLCWVFSRSTCSHIISFFSAFFGTSVFILELCIVLPVCVRTRVPRLQVCIVFAGFCRNTCSHTGSVYRFKLFVLEHVFSGYKFASFSDG